MQAIDIAGGARRPETELGAPAAGHDRMRMEPVDASEFRDMVARHMKEEMGPAKAPAGPSLGERIVNRATALSGEIKQDQQYISKTLEMATRSGDSTQLMKGMLALSDYQTRVQFISKAIAKATTAVDQLTKLQ